ncbi:MAG: biotin--[acetyl-CoA-carboxylase] ligase [Thermodesulfobacteriota bacterium]
MGVIPAGPLAPAALRDLLLGEEAQVRAADRPAEEVSRILRYGAVVGSRIERFERQGRCMEHARQLIRQHEQAGRSFPSGLVLIAGELTAGKGRFDRAWHAPQGGLWLVLVLVNTLLPEHSRFYPMAAGIACCETARQFGVAAHLKWVNDLHVSGRKLAGVLVETERGACSGEEYVLIGIGINVNNTAFPPELAGLAISMRQLLGADLELDGFAARLLAKLAWNTGLLHHAEAECLARAGMDTDPSPHPLLARWLELSDSIGRRVRFGFDVQRSPRYEAVVEGVDADGGLILRLAQDDSLVTEHAGEIVYLD